MWNLAVLTALVSLAGYYAVADKAGLEAQSQARADSLAEGMALYRDAVARYFAGHPGGQRSVDLATLRASGALPAWSPLNGAAAATPWANYRAAAGTIYIYAAQAPAENIVADVVRLSRNSVLAGVYRSGDSTLYSPIFGDTRIPLPTPADAAIPDGSPVWIVAAQ
ncbi:type IV pilus biogenesis protein PilM [Rugamonas rubra]|uniref:PilM protein n=1 Tax=Rugamonas rubra TaxID=758825 RepID=A0A1I4M5K1_9BURK|nr:type IV pilus biogenesis protein PilM [Rugamonas rubra]SFL98393.1 PilM protein [Rugamonas rubra]